MAVVSFKDESEKLIEGWIKPEDQGDIDGPAKGDWAIGLQANGLVGLEGGVTGSLSAYKPLNKKNLFLNDLKGFEYGIQGDLVHSAASYFRGRPYPLSRDSYEGFSIGVSIGGLPTWGSASGYFGYTNFIYRSTAVKP